MERYQQYMMPVLCLIVVLAVWEDEIVQFFRHRSCCRCPRQAILSKPSVRSSAPYGCIPWATLCRRLSSVCWIATVLAVLIAILMDLNRTFRHSVFRHPRGFPGPSRSMALGPLFTVLGWALDWHPKFSWLSLCAFPHRNRLFRCTSARQPQPNQSAAQFWRESVAAISICKNPHRGTRAVFRTRKSSATYCIGGVIVGEWLSASAGLGYYMIRVKNGFLMDEVSACVIMIVILELTAQFCGRAARAHTLSLYKKTQRSLVR